GALAEPVLERARYRLSRRFQDPAVHVVQPAVITAANAALADEPVLERGAPVGAVELEQPHALAPVAEYHQVLAHDAEAERHVPEIAREGDGLPEAPEVLAAGRARAHAHQLLVGRRHLAREIGSVGSIEEGPPPAHGCRYTTTTGDASALLLGLRRRLRG